jgi:hypothetical protein
MRFRGPLADSYPAAVALVVFALIPYLALTAAINPLEPILSRSLPPGFAAHSHRNSRAAATPQPIAHAASTSIGSIPGECPRNEACSALNPAPVGMTLAIVVSTDE